VEVRRRAARALHWYEAQALPAREALVGALQDRDPEVRTEAAYALGHLEQDAAALSALVAAIDDPNPRVRSAAVAGLRGELSDNAIRALGRAANDPEPTVRAVTVWTLYYLGHRARLAIPAVVRSLRYEDAPRNWRLRDYFKASAARSIAAMRDSLKSEDAATRLAGLRGLRLIGRVPIAEEIGTLLSDDPDPYVRLAAAHTLAELRDRAAKAVPALVATLEDADPSVRLAAGRALSAVGQDAVPALIRLLGEAEGEERTRVWALIRALAPEVRLPGEFLLAALNSEDPETRENAAKSLFRIEGDDLDPVRRAMEDRSVAVRIGAARAWLRRAGDAGEALPVLIAGLDAEDADHRLSAARALEELAREKKTVPEALYGLLGDPALAVRKVAGDAVFAADLLLGFRARELAGLAPPDSGFGVNPNSARWNTPKPSWLVLLSWAIRSAPPSRRWEAARDLGLLGEAAGRTAPDLAKSLRDDCERTREWAARSLVVVGSAGEGVREGLEVALTDEDPAVRADAALALWKAERSLKPPLDSLRRQLREGDATARWHAVRALREMGTESKEVERVIRIGIEDEDEIVRLAARSALRRYEEGRDR
jgi:HEAT repeat protein